MLSNDGLDQTGGNCYTCFVCVFGTMYNLHQMFNEFTTTVVGVCVTDRDRVCPHRVTECQCMDDDGEFTTESQELLFSFPSFPFRVPKSSIPCSLRSIFSPRSCVCLIFPPIIFFYVQYVCSRKKSLSPSSLSFFHVFFAFYAPVQSTSTISPILGTSTNW